MGGGGRAGAAGLPPHHHGGVPLLVCHHCVALCVGRRSHRRTEQRAKRAGPARPGTARRQADTLVSRAHPTVTGSHNQPRAPAQPCESKFLVSYTHIEYIHCLCLNYFTKLRFSGKAMEQLENLFSR